VTLDFLILVHLTYEIPILQHNHLCDNFIKRYSCSTEEQKSKKTTILYIKSEWIAKKLDYPYQGIITKENNNLSFDEQWHSKLWYPFTSDFDLLIALLKGQKQKNIVTCLLAIETRRIFNVPNCLKESNSYCTSWRSQWFCNNQLRIWRTGFILFQLGMRRFNTKIKNLFGIQVQDIEELCTGT
jgi:hypothetical protein